MARVKHAVSSLRKKKRVLKATKGQFGHRKSRYKQAKRSLIKAMRYAYRDRKVKKREFRALWNIRINAACRENGLTYSRFIKGLINAKVEINRKALADLAVTSPDGFKKLIDLAKANNPAAVVA